MLDCEKWDGAGEYGAELSWVGNSCDMGQQYEAARAQGRLAMELQRRGSLEESLRCRAPPAGMAALLAQAGRGVLAAKSGELAGQGCLGPASHGGRALRAR
jgi:acyl CoA:acetate/3-ketoacid CoA transferase alpha subunit